MARRFLQAARAAPGNRKISDTLRQVVPVRQRHSDFGPELARICALQRQLGGRGSCRLEGAILQIDAGRAQAPGAGATVDIVQFADGRLAPGWRGRVLRHRARGLHGHLARGKAADDRTIHVRVDALRDREQRRLVRLAAGIARQNDKRRADICTPDSRPGTPSHRPEAPRR